MKKPIAVRIAEAYRPGVTYSQLMHSVFPVDEYPTAMRSRTDGGPPGCSLAFGAALRRMQARWGGPGDVVWIPFDIRCRAMKQWTPKPAGFLREATNG